MAGVAKLVRPSALEVVSVAFCKHCHLVADRDLEPPAQDNAALLSLVRDCMSARPRTRLVALLDELNAAIAQVLPYLSKRYAAVRNFRQLGGAKKNAVWRFELVAEKFAEADRNTVEYLLQHTHSRVQFARLDLRNGRISHAGLPSQLPL